jgi:signal transduction histidine kinase
VASAGPDRSRGHATGVRSLRGRLSVSFVGIAVLVAVVIGLVLVPILATHYSTAARTYLEGAAERAVRDLAATSWSDRRALESEAQQLALVTQARLRITDPSGALLVDVPAPGVGASPPGSRPLPNPLGVGLFGATPDPASLPRSDQRVSRPVHRPAAEGGGLLGDVELSDAPAYEQVALMNVAEAWALASVLGVLVAALVGLLVSAWLSRPVRALTTASDRMAAGDLSARADVERADELGQLARSFNAMAVRVDGTVATLRLFVADAAHEIGTPLTALQADLELAETHAQSDDERRLVARALVQAHRLAGLASGLLRLSRLEARDTVLELQRLDLTAVAHEIVDAFASRADQAEVTLALDLPDGEVAVMGDPDRLRTAVANLVDNALKFTPPGGSVRLGVRATDGFGRVRVADTGIGIPPDDMPGLFERFHRGRNAGAYDGSGLGLAIVKATAELHGGSVLAESRGGGSSFELSLPLA